MSLSNFTRAYPATEPASGDAIILAFVANELIVKEDGDGLLLPTDADFGGRPVEGGTLYLGALGDRPCLALNMTVDFGVPDGLTAVTLKDLYGKVTDESYALAGYASQIVHWQRTSLYCPVCGHKTDGQSHDWGKICPQCGHTSYPRVSPAVLALVHDGDRILLSHKPGWGTRYSILAGFVEPGESLEECVAREVGEESGVRVADITYAGSQPWPFPHQLMIGFLAAYAGGEIAIDADELDDARWFHVDGLPDLPGPSSLSRRLIDRWVSMKRPK